MRWAILNKGRYRSTKMWTKVAQEARYKACLGMEIEYYPKKECFTVHQQEQQQSQSVWWLLNYLLKSHLQKNFKTCCLSEKQQPSALFKSGKSMKSHWGKTPSFNCTRLTSWRVVIFVRGIHFSLKKKKNTHTYARAKINYKLRFRKVCY